MPGLEILTRYDRSWLRSDLGAGLSVAAIALPVGIAYADLAGVPAVFSMYSAIFPLLAYALFGSSRQLMTGYAALLTYTGRPCRSVVGRLLTNRDTKSVGFLCTVNGNSAPDSDI